MKPKYRIELEALPRDANAASNDFRCLKGFRFRATAFQGGGGGNGNAGGST